jgi:hypothetical protein
MKNFILLGFVVLLFHSEFLSAKVIYGEDNRMEIYEVSPFERHLARSTATMVHKQNISQNNIRGYTLNQSSLREFMEFQTEEMSEVMGETITFCQEEKFVDQPSAGSCSGFLIGPDLLVTAGHCAELENFCSDYKWVFDYKVDEESQKAGSDLKYDDIYSCKKVISSKLDMPKSLDYALIQLDRKVIGRRPLDYRREGTVEAGAEIMVIGSPSGLPLKVANGARVRSNDHSAYFSANLDTFQGNSGSAVFNAKTGKVEGILVRGEEDYVFDSKRKCVRANVCPEGGCRGEDVSRLSSIPEIAIQNDLYAAAASGDVKKLFELTKDNPWVDIYGKEGVSALMVAASRGQQNAMAFLLSSGADINLQDAEGNTALHHFGAFFKEGDKGGAGIFLEEKADTEIRNEYGETALSYAARKLNVHGVRALLAMGVDKNAQDAQFENILFSFTRAKNIPVVKELIELGVDANAKNFEGKTIFDLRDASGRPFVKKTIFGIIY